MPSNVPLTLIEAADMTQIGFSVALGFLGVSVFPVLDLQHQRSFNVESPTSTSIIVMIQKRTTTWFSFQPFNS